MCVYIHIFKISRIDAQNDSFIKKIFERERERIHMQWERQREKERENLKQTPSTEHGA